MERKKGFTLIELLVVIAIIGMLLAIIMPALRRAKEIAMRVVCAATSMKAFGTANEMYANQYDGAYVPICYKKDLNPANTRIDWMRIEAFRNLLELDALKGSEEVGQYDFPDKLLCPADKISRVLENRSQQYGVLTSFAYNSTEWGGWSAINNPNLSVYIGHKSSTMKLPAERLAFVDGIDWWTHWHNANPRDAWDQYGQMSIDEYAANGVYGPVVYRHSNGANAIFYDGHVEYFQKDRMFVEEDYLNKPRRPGMWVMDAALYYKRNPGSN